MYDTLFELETTTKSSMVKHTLTYNTSDGIEICTLAVNTATIRKTFNGSMAIIDMLDAHITFTKNYRHGKKVLVSLIHPFYHKFFIITSNLCINSITV